MPELPEVETIARTLRPLIQGRVITGACLLLPRSLHPFSLPLQQLIGRQVADVTRRGKLALIRLVPEVLPPVEKTGASAVDEQSLPVQSLTEPSTTPAVLAVHLRMTGRLVVYPETEPVGKHTRAIISLHDGQQLFFDDARTFGLLMLATPSILSRWPFWVKLGPEPLTMCETDFVTRIRARAGKIKAVLLDQSVVAGVGNIYADESCFRAGIDPRRPARTLSPAHCARLFCALREVLQESIAACGSSIKDYRTARGDAGAFQNYFHVYGRAGQLCHTCGHMLENAKVAGRATVWCPFCQQ